jgi:serine/threonine protein kinase
MVETEEAENQLKKEYKIEGVIGQGAFATVRKGKHRETKERIAIKILSKKKMAEEEILGM